VEVFASRDLELMRHAAGPEMWRRHRGMELGSSGGMLRAWRRCLKRGLEEVWNSGDALQTCRRGDVEAWRSGALGACCACRDVEGFASRALEVRCCRRVDVEMQRYGDVAVCVTCMSGAD